MPVLKRRPRHIIGEAAQRYFLHPPVKPLIDLPRMGDLALKMLREALDRDVRHRATASVARDDAAVKETVVERRRWPRVPPPV